MQTSPARPHLRRAGALALVLAIAAAAPASAGPTSGELQSQLGGLQQRENGLRGKLSVEKQRIEGYQGSIDDLTQRLSGLESTLATEQAQLHATQSELRTARVRLTQLRADLKRDRKTLAAQLVAQYEMPQEDIVSVVVDSGGFSGLIEKIDDLNRLRDQNVRITSQVTVERAAVAKQTARLAKLESRRQLIADATLSQRDQVARLRIAVVDKQMVFVRQKQNTQGQLSALQAREQSLRATLKRVQAQEAAAARRAAAAQAGLSAPPTVTSQPFVAHGGSTGFFQAPGTNYSVGVEPILAQRLDKLGKALGLHLIGLSGYRTPQHSIEVGGFGDDPHTRGEASDTPGVEGVSEATLEQFGLTRPFGGAAEADHIQLFGG
jgi:septal ring factor EnvC (AmiA/AmiB activator)